MPDRLVDDHKRAKKLAEALAIIPGINIDVAEVETDIVIFGFEHPTLSVADLLNRLEDRGVLALAVPQGIRMVTNKEVDDSDVERAATAFRDILNS